MKSLRFSVIVVFALAFAAAMFGRNDVTRHNGSDEVIVALQLGSVQSGDVLQVTMIDNVKFGNSINSLVTSLVASDLLPGSDVVGQEVAHPAYLSTSGNHPYSNYDLDKAVYRMLGIANDVRQLTLYDVFTSISLGQLGRNTAPTNLEGALTDRLKYAIVCRAVIA